MASTLVFDIDSPTLGQRVGVGQFYVVRGIAAMEPVGPPTVSTAGADVESGAGGLVVVAVRSGSDYQARADGPAGHAGQLRSQRAVRPPFLWG